MQAIGDLGPDEDLLLIAPFEPVPLISVLQKSGLGYESRQSKTGDWEVRFSRSLPRQSVPAGPPPTAAENNVSGLNVDARGLEPPQPLVRILEALQSLSRGTVLRARTDRRPIHLFAQLESRGFNSVCAQQSDGSFITHIRHATR